MEHLSSSLKDETLFREPRSIDAAATSNVDVPIRPRPMGGGDSPESNSLYSDDIPSGYNSGEQYDTLSTGYMSGEAYELPDTRMDLREPALDVIEEFMQQSGGEAGGADNDQESVFSMGPVHVHLPTVVVDMDGDTPANPSTSSSESDGNGAGADGDIRSPTYGSVKGALKHTRKKTTTFAIPIDDVQDPESSDVGLTLGNYRSVPSDTDTSAFDSDANLIALSSDAGMHTSDSGAELLGKKSPKGRGLRRKKKKVRDEEWFNSHDTKYWSWMRILCFWGANLAIITSIVVAGIFIAYMPHTCDPYNEWFQGTVSMDVLPKKGPNGSWNLDLVEVIRKVPEYKSLGIQTLHLKDLTRKNEGNSWYPSVDWKKVITKVIGGNPNDIANLTKALHQHNMTIMIQIPVIGKDDDSMFGRLSLDVQHAIGKAIAYFGERGVDGIFLQGLEEFGADTWIDVAIEGWKVVLDRFGTSPNKRILMTSYKFARSLDEAKNPKLANSLSHLSLLDATLDFDHENMTETSERLADLAKWDAVKGRPWINWNLKWVNSLPLTKAALALQMLLPGTINIRPLNSTATDEGLEQHLKNLTSLRTLAVPIYMNGNYKRCDCDEKTTKETNYVLSEPIPEVVQLERFYSRRHRYILVANFGDEEGSLESVGRVYSGGELLLDTSRSLPLNQYLEFKSVTLQPGHALVIKLPK